MYDAWQVNNGNSSDDSYNRIWRHCHGTTHGFRKRYLIYMENIYSSSLEFCFMRDTRLRGNFRGRTIVCAETVCGINVQNSLPVYSCVASCQATMDNALPSGVWRAFCETFYVVSSAAEHWVNAGQHWPSVKLTLDDYLPASIQQQLVKTLLVRIGSVSTWHQVYAGLHNPRCQLNTECMLASTLPQYHQKPLYSVWKSPWRYYSSFPITSGFILKRDRALTPMFFLIFKVPDSWYKE